MLKYKLNIKPFRFFISLSIFMFLFLQSAWGQEVNILQGNISFKLEIKGQGLKYFVRVNDVVIFSQYDEGTQNSLQLPINQWMHPEKNIFNIIAGPDDGGDFPSDGSVSLALLVQDRDSEASYRLPILKLASNEVHNPKSVEGILNTGRYNLSVDNKVVFGEGEVELSKVNKSSPHKGWFEYSRVVTALNSLPLWSFFNSEALPDYSKMSKDEINDARNDLFIEYKKVRDALATGDIDSIIPMYEEHNREVELALDLEPGTMAVILKESMVSNFNDPDNKLNLLPAPSFAVNREANGKLVSLTLNNRVNAIGFENANGINTTYPMKFRRENGQWILTR